ncbi:hypothetical protein M413DRAFT_338008 [Hebeloma cylindrosporum]|uniref:Uncharacterized protein n=1 Tax=Hebeloma cylindrosporum TaxID=76867 RepID=A0A0C3CMH7_HEBCY|nr:hypothetical protein M413DRAFT_338008 [Hebeloma cylindrosporum h7]
MTLYLGCSSVAITRPADRPPFFFFFSPLEPYLIRNNYLPHRRAPMALIFWQLSVQSHSLEQRQQYSCRRQRQGHVNDSLPETLVRSWPHLERGTHVGASGVISSFRPARRPVVDTRVNVT